VLASVAGMFVVGMYEADQKATRLRRAVAEQRQRISRLHAMGYPTRYAQLETMLKTLGIVEAQQSLRLKGFSSTRASGHATRVAPGGGCPW
jgi:hypothetical protein